MCHQAETLQISFHWCLGVCATFETSPNLTRLAGWVPGTVRPLHGKRHRSYWCSVWYLLSKSIVDSLLNGITLNCKAILNYDQLVEWWWRASWDSQWGLRKTENTSVGYKSLNALICWLSLCFHALYACFFFPFSPFLIACWIQWCPESVECYCCLKVDKRKNRKCSWWKTSIISTVLGRILYSQMIISTHSIPKSSSALWKPFRSPKDLAG